MDPTTDTARGRRILALLCLAAHLSSGRATSSANSPYLHAANRAAGRMHVRGTGTTSFAASTRSLRCGARTCCPTRSERQTQVHADLHRQHAACRLDAGRAVAVDAPGHRLDRRGRPRQHRRAGSHRPASARRIGLVALARRATTPMPVFRRPRAWRSTVRAGRTVDRQRRWSARKSINNDVMLGLCLLAFPRAIAIHCRRHPLDVCLSAYPDLSAATGIHAQTCTGWRRATNSTSG